MIIEHLFSFVLFLPPILMALTIHEYAHGYIALRNGDPTAKFAGRLTFNPIKHIDIFGLIAFLVFHIGWAKPVPINPNNFHDLRNGVIQTSLAGPLSNFLIAIPFGLLHRIFPGHIGILYPFYVMIEAFVVFNLIFCAFNLIPIPPLDGSHILFEILPARYAYLQHRLAQYGFYIIIALILLDNITGIPVIWGWIGPFARFFGTLFAGHLTMI
jgi:Zn-dependent protease